MIKNIEMTKAANKTAEELQSNIEYFQTQISTLQKRGDSINAQTLQKYLDYAKEELKKKTQPESAILEQPAEPTKAGQPEQRAESNNEPINSLDNTSSNIIQNTEVIKEHFKFVTKDAFEDFDKLRRQLNQYLRNWILKKDTSKERFQYLEMNVKVELVLREIDNIIEEQGRSDFNQVIKETTYLIGLKDDKRRYGFDIEKLKLNFGF